MPSHLITDYGYLALAIGCLLEGETLLLIAGFAVHQGYLSMPVVLVVASVCATLGDQIFFWIGRYGGTALLRRWDLVRERADSLIPRLRRFDAAWVVLVRFMYGFRIAGPIIIGAAHMPPLRFAFFNALGACVWAPLIAGLGYAFGHELEGMQGNLQTLEAQVLAGIVILIASIKLTAFVLRHIRRRPR